MRRALRRLLWLLPELLLVSILAFALLATTFPDESKADMPLFFNAHPGDVRERAQSLMQATAKGDERAAAELASLGGAGLPHILPRLDTLPPRERERVALALGPVARRMQLGTDSELDSPESAVTFWNRFWQDRSVDFRAPVVRRSVRRVAQRPSPHRLAEVRHLDTFALPELMRALDASRSEAETGRLAGLAAHATGKPWRLREGASAAEARALTRRWQRWWFSERSKYVASDGPQRLAAMIVHTRYSHWLVHTLRDAPGPRGSPWARMARGGPITLLLLAAAALGAFLFAPLCVWSGLLRDAPARTTALTCAGLAVFAVRDGGPYVAMACMVLLGALGSLLAVERSTSRELEQPWVVTRRAFGSSRRATRGATLRAGAVTPLAALGAGLPAALTASALIEHATGVEGLGSETARALHSGDVDWLMALVLFAAVAARVLLAGSDAATDLLDRRGAKRIRP